MKTRGMPSLVLGLSVCCLIEFAPVPAGAQGGGTRQSPPVSLDLRDAPVRQALEQLFTNAKVDYTIDSNVQGYITLRVTDQPLENALRLLLRSANPPLTYTNQDGVYIVRPRVVATAPVAPALTAPPETAMTDLGTTASATVFTKLPPLVYQDAGLMAPLLGGRVVPIERTTGTTATGNTTAGNAAAGNNLRSGSLIPGASGFGTAMSGTDLSGATPRATTGSTMGVRSSGATF